MFARISSRKKSDAGDHMGSPLHCLLVIQWLSSNYIWLRVPMYQSLFKRMDEMPEQARDFMLAHTKNCNDCRYCVQTDKTGARPLAAIKAGGKDKCPRYPAFTLNWRELSEETSENILAALDAMDAMLDTKY